MPIEDWIIPVKNKQNLLKRINMPDDLLKLINLYGTDVAIIVHLKINKIEEFKNNITQIKEALGRLLRLIVDFAEQFEFYMPIIGLFEESDKEVGEYIRKWAADQDWHMGEFSLLLAEKGQEKELIKEILSGAHNAWGQIPKFDPITLEDFIKGLEIQKNSADFSDNHKQLIKIILESISGEDLDIDKNIETNINKWLQTHKQHIKMILDEGDNIEDF